MSEEWKCLRAEPRFASKSWGSLLYLLLDFAPESLGLAQRALRWDDKRRGIFRANFRALKALTRKMDDAEIRKAVGKRWVEEK